MSAQLVYITANNKEEAQKIGGALLEDRLVACVNIIDSVSSMYWWEGAIQTDSETILIAKTTDALVDEVVARVQSVHSYTCPCTVALPITNGNPDFLRWIHEETKGQNQ